MFFIRAGFNNHKALLSEVSNRVSCMTTYYAPTQGSMPLMSPLTLLLIIGTFPNYTTDTTCSAPSMGLLPPMPPNFVHQTVVYLNAQFSQHLLRYWHTPYLRKSTTQGRKISCSLVSHYQFLLTSSRWTLLHCDNGWMDGTLLEIHILVPVYIIWLITSKETEM